MKKHIIALYCLSVSAILAIAFSTWYYCTSVRPTISLVQDCKASCECSTQEEYIECFQNNSQIIIWKR